MLHFIYAHSETSGTIGYFSCTPEQKPDIWQTLALLRERPLDTFLHEYALDLLDKLPDDHLQSLLDEDNPALLALFAELLMLKPGNARLKLRERLNNAPVTLAHTPLPLLTLSPEEWGEKEKSIRIFRENLERLRPLPADLSLGAFARDLPQNRLDNFLAIAHGLLKDRLKPGPAEPLQKDFWRKAEERLLKAGLAAFPEMRHEASLSPIALLREWPVSFAVRACGNPHAVSGKSTAYGRGLTLAQARTSLRMEIAERASAYARIGEDENIQGLAQKTKLVRASIAELEKTGERFFAPFPETVARLYHDIPFYWLPAATSQKEPILAPCQAIFLFCNLEEPSLFDTAGSTGLGAGQTEAQAKLSALLEIVERDAHASSPYLPDRCFRLASRDPLLNDLFLDYAARRIFPVFQDITTELGVPAYRCVVRGQDGEAVMGSCARLSGKQAALGALTETPWPYSWATPAPYGKPSQRPPEDMPWKFLEDLPDYEPASMEDGLRLLEKTLELSGHVPLYFNLEREDLGLPVYRALIPGLETHAEFDPVHPPAKRFMANTIKYLYKSTE